MHNRSAVTTKGGGACKQRGGAYRQSLNPKVRDRSIDAVNDKLVIYFFTTFQHIYTYRSASNRNLSGYKIVMDSEI